ncbi:hypothetical protein J6590_071229 [Homalodisca vitripennis]|nr:hypothetical protein J6590_071229 [Homalodisca vitripennis]
MANLHLMKDFQSLGNTYGSIFYIVDTTLNPTIMNFTQGLPMTLISQHTEASLINERSCSPILKAMRAEVWRARTESPLFDCKQYAQGMEKLYRIMWNRYANGEKPDHISAQTID